MATSQKLPGELHNGLPTKLEGMSVFITISC